jgi:hypothetical protein
MKNMQEYHIKVLWYKYTILRRVIQDKRCGTRRPKTRTMEQVRKILIQLEGKTLSQLIDIHQAYLY